MTKRSRTVLLASALALGVGCASVPPPKDEMVRTKAAIAEAEEADAREHAPLALRLAEEKLAKAEKAVADEEFDQARRLLAEASVDAEYAEARSLNAKAQASLKEVRAGIRTLRNEIRRNQGDA